MTVTHHQLELLHRDVLDLEPEPDHLLELLELGDLKRCPGHPDPGQLCLTCPTLELCASSSCKEAQPAIYYCDGTCMAHLQRWARGAR